MAAPRPADLTDAITHNPLTIGPGSSVMDAIALMSSVRTLCPTDRDHTTEDNLHLEIRSSCVVVVDDDQVVGILTERDVVRLSAQQQPLDQLSAAEVMTQSVITRRQSDLTDLFGTIDLLRNYHIRHLPIVDEQGRLVGLITHESLRQLTRPVDLLRLRLVQEVMATDVLCASPDGSMLEIAQLMADRRVSSVVIAVPGGRADAPFQRAVGLLTERDLVQFQALGLSLTETAAQAVMSSPVFTVAPGTSLWEVQQIMERHWVRRVVVAGKQGELLGIVTQTSLLQALNPIELYQLAEVLEQKVVQLETERIALLQNQAAELEWHITESNQAIRMQAEIDHLLQGFAIATTHLMTLQDGHASVQAALDALGSTLRVDRSYIFENHPHPTTGTMLVSQRWEWVAEGVTRQIDNPELQNIPFAETIPSWHQSLSRGQTVVGLTKDFPKEEQALLASQGIVSILLVPIFIQDYFWGLVGFDDCHRERIWENGTQSALKAIAGTIGSAIARRRAEANATLLADRLKEAQRIAYVGNWEQDLQRHTFYWSEEVFRILEIDSQQLGASYETFLGLVHPDDRTLVDEAYANHLRSRQPSRLVHRLQMPDGRVKYVQEQWETTYRADGTPLISRGTMQDVTQQKEAELRRDRAEAALRQVVEGTAAVTDEAFFPALVRHISEALGVRYASIDQAMPDGFQVLAFFADGELSLPLFLPYDELPCCFKSLQAGSCCHPSGVQALYPGNTLFTDLQVDSYIGVRLQNAAGDPIGNLCILHDAPLADPDWAQTLLTIVAARAGAELERLITAQALEQLNRELEDRVAERTAELVEREDLLQDFLDNANDLIQIVAIDTGRFEFVNRAWRDVLGYTAAEVDQLTIFDVLAPDCLPHCQQVMDQMLAGTLINLERVELSFIHKSGQSVLVEGSINCRFGVSADGRQQTLSTRAIFRDITARKAAERELQRREARYRALMEGASDAILLANSEGYLIEVNPQAVELMGYDHHELLGMHITQIHPPEILSAATEAFGALAQGGRIDVLNFAILRRDGQRVPVDITGSVIEVEGETIIQGIFHDIRERLQAEQALRESEIRFRRVFESNVVGMMFADFSGRISDANDCFLDMLGYSRQELESGCCLNWADLTPPEYQAQDQTAINHLQHHEAITPWEKVYRHKDGHLVPVLIGVAMLSRAEGSCVCVVVDISDRKRYEVALQESEKFLQTILDTVPLSVFWKDRASNYLGANQRFLRDAALDSVSELVGKTDLDLPWGATESEAYRADDHLVMESGEAKLGIIETLHRQDGAGIWLETSKLPLRNLAGDVIGVLGTYQDITERRNADIALQRQLALIEAAVNGIAILQDGCYLYLNSSHVELFGYQSTKELVGKSWRVLYSPEEQERLDQEIWPALSERMSWQGEVTATRKDGTTFPEQLSLTLSADNLIICVCEDISDRKREQAALQQKTTELDRFFSLAIDLLCIATLDGRFVRLNHQWEKVLGYPLSALEGLSFISFVHPEDVDATLQTMGTLEQGGEILSFTNRYRCGDGSYRWIEWRSAPSGDLIYAAARDITERKQSEDALRESEEKFRQLAEVVDAVFWILHLNRTDRVYVSPAYERIWGRPCVELYVTPDAWVEMIHPDDRELVLAAIPKQIQGTFDEEYRIIRPDGTQRWIHDRAFPIRNAQGQVYRLAGIAEDITERKRSEKIIRQQAERETVLREITQRIRESLDLQTIFDTACEEIRICLRADRVGIFKFYPNSGYDDGEFVAESVMNGFPSVVAIRVHDHCFGENYANLYAQGRYYVVDDIYHNGLTPCHTDVLAQFQVQANLVMPLLCNHQLWGLLCIHQCDAPRHWHQSEIDLGQQLSNQLAIAIQQAILYEQLQTELQERQRAEATITQQLRQQTALELILQQIRQSLDLPEILAIATQQVQDLLGGDRVIVFQVCHNGHSHILEEAVASDLPRLKAMQWEDETWSQDILERYWQGQPRIVPDVMNDLWTDCLVDYSQAGQIQSKIVAPILQELRDTEAHRWVSPHGHNKLWGVLVVHACRTRRVWQPEEAQLLQQIANQLAVAIQQASLFEQLQQELQERQQAQTQLTLTNQELMRATRLKDEFLANMSHELRTPLNAILGMTEVLQDEDVFGPVNAQQLKALKTVERSGIHLLELINDVLDVAKIESGKLELDCHPTAIAPLCQSSIAFIKQPALKKGLRLTVNLPPTLPEITLDERRMRQVLINLLNNAVKFTPEGGRVTLDVSLLPPTQSHPGMPYLRFAVTDTGIGITPENMQCLFQPFVQVDSALNRQYQGTGLGLALVKRIVELHGGQVSLTSDVGVGSCFTVDLPCGAVITPSPAPAPLPDAAPLPLPDAAPDTPASMVVPPPATEPLILLAEDNEANISTLMSYLQAKGYRVDIAHNGEEALEQAQRQIPDLILMDIQMPKMDGLEAIGHLRRIPSLAEVPVIALTSLAMPGDRDRCMAVGATDYLTKPVRLKQLVERIHTLLND